MAGKYERDRKPGKSKRRWEDNIRMDFRQLVGKLWTGFTWLRTGTKSGFL
jgi:hypothetical protein